MKIAIVHDHFMEIGGAERVAAALVTMYPQADVYTAAVDWEKLHQVFPESKEWKMHTSWYQNIPFYNKLYSPLRFLAPWIWESFDFSEYDIVVSSSGWYMAKGIITKGKTTHICYLHHQPRYLYFYETSVEWQKYLVVKIYAYFINHFLRMWDYTGSQRPDYFVANSQETLRRLKKFYRREGTVIYPPVYYPADVKPKQGKGDYYVTLSRLVKTKHVQIMIEAARKSDFKLKIIGQGRDEDYLKSLAGNDERIEFLGRLADDKVGAVYTGATAYLNAGVDEEFGIAPVEAMGYGLPVIAFASGGLMETVTNGKNGFLFKELTPESLAGAIDKMEKLSDHAYRDMSAKARQEANKYAPEVFAQKIKDFIRTHARTTRS